MRPHKVFLALALGVIATALMVCLISCGQPAYYPPPSQVVVQQPVQSAQDYQIIQDPYTGRQMAVFYDNGVQMMVELAMFNSWMDVGGYSYVIHHYHSYPNCRPYDRTRYSSWRTTSRGSYNTYKPSSSSQFRNTTPAATTSQFRNTSPKPTSGSSFRSTTPVSSSNSFRSTTPRSSSGGGGFRRTH